MAATRSLEALTELLTQTSERHHAAYAVADGADPEWPLWYASDLQARLWDDLGRVPTRSELVALLVDAERDHRRSGSTEPWAAYYAARLLAGLGGEGGMGSG
jgi:hypothetical protein